MTHVLRITPRVRFGFFRHGNCWRFLPSIRRYHTVTYYGFWRLYCAVEK